MSKESLSKFIQSGGLASYIPTENVKEKIQNVQKRLKEFEWFIEDEELWEDTVKRFEEHQDKIFLEEIGEFK